MIPWLVVPERPMEAPSLGSRDDWEANRRMYIQEERKCSLQSFLLLLDAAEPFRSGEGERLRSHSAMRLEAVRWSLEGASLEMAGQGMPSVTLGSGAVEVGFQSPKLSRASAHNEVVIDEIRKSRNVPSTRSGAAALRPGRLVVFRGFDRRATGRGRMSCHLRRGQWRVPHVPVIDRVILHVGWIVGVLAGSLGVVRAPRRRSVYAAAVVVVVGGAATSIGRRLRW